MKNLNYRLVQKLLKLAILIVKLVQEILKLLSMAFNYPNEELLSYGIT